MSLTFFVQTNGLGFSLFTRMKSSITATSSGTLRKTPRRMRRVISANYRSTRFSQDELVGVKCRRKRGVLSQPCLDLGMMARAVVVQAHVDVQIRRHATVDLSQEFPKFHIPVSEVAGADDLPFQHVERREHATEAKKK